MNTTATADQRSIAMLPGPSNRTDWDRIGNGHLRALTAELARLGWTAIDVRAKQLLAPSNGDQPALVTHIHWTETLTLEAPQPKWVKAVTILQTIAGQKQPHFLLQRFARSFLRSIAARRPLVYQVHDLESNWLEPARAHLLDRAFKLACLRESHAWVVHERSCLPILEQVAPQPPLVAVCPLGDYSRFHGPAVSRADARRRFGWPEHETIFLYAGYAGARRNPTATAAAFSRLQKSNTRLVVASSNARRFLPAVSDRIDVMDQLLDNETVRDLYCAADWVVMPGRAYLNSAVVRTALSYARPVISIRFGSQSDMAHEAALWLENDSADAIYRQLSRACSFTREQCETYRAAAVARSSERSWSKSTHHYVSLLERVVGQSKATKATLP